MKSESSPKLLKLDLTVAAILIGFVIAAFVFRENLGLWVFAVLALAAVIQLIRVMLLRGKRETLKTLWSALKDAFWGIG